MGFKLPSVSGLASSAKSAAKSKASGSLGGLKNSASSLVSGKLGGLKNSASSLVSGKLGGLKDSASSLVSGKLGAIASAASLAASAASLAASASSLGSLAGGFGSMVRSNPLASFGAGGLSGFGSGYTEQSNTYVFTVEIDGMEGAVFEDCSGLSVHTDVVEIAEGGENTTTRKLYGNTHYDNVRLSKGVSSGDNALLEWLQQSTSASTLEKKSASLVMKSLAGEEMKRWNIYGAMPVKWDLPTNSKDKAGKNSAVVIENIEFAIDRFEVV